MKNKPDQNYFFFRLLSLGYQYFLSLSAKFSHNAVHNKFVVLVLCFFSDAVMSSQSSIVEQLIELESKSVTGQKVSVRYDQLNLASGWALAYGELYIENGELDWEAVPSCDANLDKGLWAVLKLAGNGWEFIEYDACSIEPPYWYIELESNQWPCALFEGLKVSADETLQERCESRRDKNE